MQADALLHLNLNRHGGISRRNFLQSASLGIAGSALLSQFRLNAAELKKEGRSCILVWLAGAPSQMETWDPKPGTPNGGETKKIATQTPGIEIAHYWPKIAAVMNDIAVIRSMTGKEAAHERGTYHLHTGHRMLGIEKFPHFGSVVAREIGDPQSDIPNFVSIGQTLSSGFLGVQVAPFIIDRPGQLPDNVFNNTPASRQQRRLALLSQQESDFADAGAAALVKEQSKLYQKANLMMLSPRLKAFEFDNEPTAMKEAYGKSQLGQGLLVARRLVEVGVPFVEVRSGGWDMHSNVFKGMERRAPDVDQGLSQLLIDLKQRGLLEKTLVLCMGEFGRTPKINARPPAPGRDHWVKNFNLLMAGAGIKGGQAIGKTDENGQKIVDSLVEVDDLFRSMCHAMKINADLELHTPIGRPVKLVESGTVIKGLFG
ncbi:DUF1501 domain-containing protein [uncultured Gimesia sp.]|uniref:DUF1501 domain-containing protein n=1 Tax=uncultured Gimesia sp. TaxID=1678688 RepID=UPI0030D6F885|tara:strand:- start:63059 stop:64342 length:1284 start_codon:yes stop_codon:yes gene_type:complete